MVCLSRLSTTNFTWSILEYFVPFEKIHFCFNAGNFRKGLNVLYTNEHETIKFKNLIYKTSQTGTNQRLVQEN